jgi:molybdopterin converting factor subunit 1
MVRVLLFAQAAAAAGTPVCEWSIATPQQAQAFWEWLLAAHPALAHMPNICRLARNGEYMHANEMILPGDELAVIPPVSGG